MYKYYDMAMDLFSKFWMEFKQKRSSEKTYYNKKFYQGKVERFFKSYMGEEAMQNRPINEITSYDISRYLDSFLSNKYNQYSGLKSFFDFCYRNNLISRDLMKDVQRPPVTEAKESLI